MLLEIKFSTFIRYRIDRTLRDLITKKNEPYFFIHTHKLNHAAYHIQFFNLNVANYIRGDPSQELNEGKYKTRL